MTIDIDNFSICSVLVAAYSYRAGDGTIRIRYDSLVGGLLSGRLRGIYDNG